MQQSYNSAETDISLMIGAKPIKNIIIGIMFQLKRDPKTLQVACKFRIHKTVNKKETRNSKTTEAR